MAPSDVSHYVVAPHNGEEFNVHFNNTQSHHDDHALAQGLLHGFILPSPTTALGVQDHFTTTTSVYRKMSAAEVDATFRNNGLAPSIRNTNSRKYVTDSLSKAVDFSNKAVSAENVVGEKIVEFKVDRQTYKVIKETAIPQLNARRVNPTADVYNLEGIKPNSGKVNLGIHKNNINYFNNSVKDIHVINPKSPKVANRYLRYLLTHKLKVASHALMFMYEAGTIGMAFYKDGFKVGERTVDALSTSIGAAIGGAIFSLIPGVGTAVGGFLGGLAGGLVGSGLGSVICSYLFPHADQPNIPPPREYLSLLYDSPDCEFKNIEIFGAPDTEYVPYGIFGAPSTGFQIDIYGAPSPW